MTEIWLPVVGYEGYYEVSDHGHVKSLARTVARKNGTVQKVTEKLLSTGEFVEDPKLAWYSMVSLRKNGKRRTEYVHHLMAYAFLGPRPLGLEVCHKDDNKSHNMLSNLKYGTSSDNTADSLRNGTAWPASKELCVRGHELPLISDKLHGKSRRCEVCRSNPSTPGFVSNVGAHALWHTKRGIVKANCLECHPELKEKV